MKPLESTDLAFLNINLFGVDVEKFITENGLGKKVVGREQQNGYVVYPLYRLNLKKIQGGSLIYVDELSQAHGADLKRLPLASK